MSASFPIWWRGIPPSILPRKLICAHVPSSMIPSGIRTLVDQQSTDALSALMADTEAEPPESDATDALQGIVSNQETGLEDQDR